MRPTAAKDYNIKYPPQNGHEYMEARIAALYRAVDDPGQWVELTTHASGAAARGVARRLRQRRVGYLPRPEGDWSFVCRRNSPNTDETTVWARYYDNAE